MPAMLPARSTRSWVSRAAWAAWPPERSTGIVPVPTKNIRVSQPLIPLPVKYSALATNVTLRFTINGVKIESENDRWLLARMTGPVRGTLLEPLDLRPEDQLQDAARAPRT